MPSTPLAWLAMLPAVAMKATTAASGCAEAVLVRAGIDEGRVRRGAGLPWPAPQ
jgi:hypothetical protein